MRIGGEDRPQWVIERHWEQFAREIGIGYKLVRQTLLEMSGKIVVEATAQQKTFTAQYGECEIIKSIITVIETGEQGWLESDYYQIGSFFRLTGTERN